MNGKKEHAAIVGVGVAACAACCAGPILGVLAAVGLGTAAGLALFGGVAVVLGAALVAVVVLRRRRRRRAASCAVTTVPESVPVLLHQARSPS